MHSKLLATDENEERKKTSDHQMKVIEHIVLFFFVDRNEMIVVHGTTKQLEFVNTKQTTHLSNDTEKTRHFDSVKST